MGMLGDMDPFRLTISPPRQPDALDALVAALQAQTAAIEGLVAVNAALLDRLPVPGEEEPSEPDDGIPQPLGRPR